MLKDLEFGTVQVILITKPSSVLVGITNNGDWIAEWVDAANVTSFLGDLAEKEGCKFIQKFARDSMIFCILLTVLIDQHSNADARHVKTIQEILN